MSLSTQRVVVGLLGGGSNAYPHPNPNANAMGGPVLGGCGLWIEAVLGTVLSLSEVLCCEKTHQPPTELSRLTPANMY